LGWSDHYMFWHFAVQRLHEPLLRLMHSIWRLHQRHTRHRERSRTETHSSKQTRCQDDWPGMCAEVRTGRANRTRQSLWIWRLPRGKTSHNGCFNVHLVATRGRSATAVASHIIINTCNRPHPPDVTDLGRSQPHLRPTTAAPLATATASRCPSLIVMDSIMLDMRKGLMHLLIVMTDMNK
jgi:hypothetical protein